MSASGDPVAASLAQPLAYVLVESGLHAGARLELLEEHVWYSVGGRVDSDFWLADDGAIDSQLRFCLAESEIEVRIEIGPTASVDGQLLQEGAQTKVLHRLVWGGVDLRVVVMSIAPPPASVASDPFDAAAAAEPRPTVAPQRPTWLAAMRGRVSAKTAMWLLAGLAVGLPLAMLMSTLSGMLERINQREMQAKALAAQDSPEARLARAGVAAQRLGDLIGMPGVSVSVVDRDTLALQGNGVQPEMRPTIDAAVRRFASELRVLDQIAYGADPAPHPVQLTRLPEGADLAQFDDEGFLRGRNGLTYLVGSKLPDGSVIANIGSSEIQIRRGQVVTVLRAPQTNLANPSGD